MSLSQLACFIETFLVGNFISNFSTEILKVCTGRICATYL